MDRARVLRKVAGPMKVEGRRLHQTVEGEWFRCRLFLEGATEDQDAGWGRRKTVARPQMMCGVRDVAGNAIEIRASDEILITSPELGEARWKVNGDPQPIRKKRPVIGFLVELERLHEPERETV